MTTFISLASFPGFPVPEHEYVYIPAYTTSVFVFQSGDAWECGYIFIVVTLLAGFTVFFRRVWE